MALRKPNSSDERKSVDRKAYRVDDTDNSVAYRATADEIAHSKLDQIIAGVGGGVDTTTFIYNVNIILPNTEISQELPANTKKFIVRSRNRGEVRLAYSSNGTNTAWVTIKKTAVYVDEEYYVSQVLYLQSDVAGDVIEIIAHT